jgi:2-keto-4-pentenoate hydratase/2-oxohepta-3-ene-1,7-dioic acid hydratase in catechol pathway
MRIGRAERGGRAYLVRIEEDDTVVPIAAQPSEPGRDPLREALAGGTAIGDAPACAESGPLATFHLLAPVVAPQKLLAIGLNYADHARESGLEPPSAPITFVKTPNSICGPGDPIKYSHVDSTQVDYEVELAVVIGKPARRITVEQALDHVLGYTVCNDVSARDAQFADVQWVRAKSFDTFSPLGPWIVTTDEIHDPQSLGIRCRVNGATLQDSTTAEMIFSCAEIVSYLSRVMTLEPGDVIATGTPFGVGFARTPPVFLLHGDEVEVEVDGIGTLTNSVEVD